MITSGMLGLRVDHRSAVDGHVRLGAKYVVLVFTGICVSIVSAHGECATATRYGDEGHAHTSK